MTADLVTELHALAVLDVLEAAQQVVAWFHEHKLEYLDDHAAFDAVHRLDDAIYRLDRLEVVQAAA